MYCGNHKNTHCIKKIKRCSALKHQITSKNNVFVGLLIHQYFEQRSVKNYALKKTHHKNIPT